MPVISVRIPQLGEGLQEALLVEFLKKPGDRVKRDDPIYVMETDKATTDVESPYEGTITEWTVQTGTVLPIGAEIGKMEVAQGVKEMPVGHGPADAHPSTSGAVQTTPRPSAYSDEGDAGDLGDAKSGRLQIPPKTRKYLKEKGLLEVAHQIPAAGKKLMPDDVDAYLAAGGTAAARAPAGARPTTTATGDFDVIDLPSTQIVLNYRLVRGTQVCVPVTVMNEIDWTAIDAARRKNKSSGGPTPFAMSCWCVVQAMTKHPKFRSVLSADGRSLKVFKHINLGIAVALVGDEMVTAVVRNADTLTPSTFFENFARQIDIARDGKDQADESTTLTVSNIGKAGMKIGIPAIVAPAVATLAFGQTYQLPIPADSSFRFQPTVTAVLSFDHRIANGVGAANFLNDIRTEVENYK